MFTFLLYWNAVYVDKSKLVRNVFCYQSRFVDEYPLHKFSIKSIFHILCPYLLTNVLVKRHVSCINMKEDFLSLLVW